MEQNRKNILKKLVSLSWSIEKLSKELGKLDWDIDGDSSMIMTYAHLINVLEKYIDGSLTNKEIESWANLVECREDISFQANDDFLNDIIYQLANPELEGKTTKNKAQDLIGTIKSKAKMG